MKHKPTKQDLRLWEYAHSQSPGRDPEAKTTSPGPSQATPWRLAGRAETGSKARFFHALLNPLSPLGVCHEQVPLLQHHLESVHHLVEAAGCASFLGQSDHAEITSPASLKDREETRVEVDGLQV